MKKLSLWVVSLWMTATLSAQDAGYALFGAVPEGYTDYTAMLDVTNVGTVEEGVLQLTGLGLPGRLGESNYLSIPLSEPVTMSLTENYAIHVVLKRDASSNNVQIVLCKNRWNDSRAAFEIPADAISAEDFVDVALRYEDRRVDNWNSYGEASMINAEGVEFPAAEILRICAAQSEVLYISQIYIEAEAPAPVEPEDPEDPEPQAHKRFYFFRAGDLPVNDTVDMVDLREGVGSTLQLNNMLRTEASDYIGYTLNGSWFSFNQNLSATTDMSVVSQSSWYLCIKMRTTVSDNSFNFRLNNAGECYMLSTGNLPLNHDGTWETLALPLSEASRTLNYTAAMSGTVFQMHANGSASDDVLDILYAYLTDDPTIPESDNADDPVDPEDPDPEDPEPIDPDPEEPDPQDPMRIYLRQGTALTPAAIESVIDYSGMYYGDAWEGAAPQEMFDDGTMGVISAGWWFKYFWKATNDIDLTAVNKNWKMVIRFASDVVETGQDRNYSLEVAGKGFADRAYTVADSAQFVVWEFDFAEILSGAENLGQITANENLFALASSNNGQARSIRIDYLYLTNSDAVVDPVDPDPEDPDPEDPDPEDPDPEDPDPEDPDPEDPDPEDPDTGIHDVVNSHHNAVKHIRRGMLLIEREGQMYHLNGSRL